MTTFEDINAVLKAGETIQDDTRVYWLMDDEVYSCCFNGCCEADWPSIDAWWQANVGRDFRVVPPDFSFADE